MIPLPLHAARAPRRKFRGKSRYFRGILRKAEAFRVDPRPEAWWNFWHYHADWPGWGNARWRYRRDHLAALAVVFRTILEAGPRIAVPFQAWWVLTTEDAGQDGVFLHSPNPHGSAFPWKAEGVDWTTTALDSVLSELLPGVGLRVGRSTWLDASEEGDEGAGPPRMRASYLIYAPGVGVPIA